MRFSLVTLLCGLSVSLLGQNLVDNGLLEGNQGDWPDNWQVSQSGNVVYSRSGGPGGFGVLTLNGEINSFVLRQQGIALAPGEKYRISAMIRTKDLKYKRGGLVIHNDSWKKDSGLRKFPANTGWRKVEAEFTAFPSPSGRYGLAFFLSGASGQIAIADIRLEALTPKGRQESASPQNTVKNRFLVPVTPLLSRIPAARPQLTLYWAYPVPDDTLCRINIDNDPERTFQVKDHKIEVDLNGFAPGRHQLKAELFSGAGILHKAEYPIMIIEQPEYDLSRFKRLNQLVLELKRQPLDGVSEIQFVNPRRGWVWIGLGNGETMRWLEAGEHVWVVPSGSSGEAVVRAIPELFHYPACYNSYVPGNGKYDWNFHQKYIMDACNVLNGGNMAPQAQEELKLSGRKWLANMNIKRSSPSEELAGDMEKSPGMADSRYDGLTADELFFYRNPVELENYSESLRLLNNPGNKLVYTWFVGAPAIQGLHHYFMASAINVSDGMGKMLYEAYCQPQPTEEAARKFLQNKITGAVETFNRYIPGINPNMGVILCNSTQIPVLSFDHLPEVDIKYYLDMQLNQIANSPECRDLGAIGYWGGQYADEETLRWSFRLMRHYGVEGKTTMLSDEYGYKYKPGLLHNGDFSDDTRHWNCEGDLTVGKIQGYGSVNQKRYSGGAAGDIFIIFNGGKLSQMATGLVPGKLYSLQFVVAAYDDVLNKVENPRKLPLTVNLGNVEIIKDKSFVYVDNRKSKTAHGRVNFHRIVFRANSAEQRIEFSDSDSKEKLILNFVQLKPYFEN